MEFESKRGGAGEGATGTLARAGEGAAEGELARGLQKESWREGCRRRAGERAAGGELARGLQAR